jgi:hypothetical protein
MAASATVRPPDKRPIVMICGCQKYLPYLKAAMMRLVHPEWQVVGILGDPTLSAPKLEGAILTLPVPDTYEGLPAKVHAGFTWLAEKLPNAVGIFKTDDDIIFPDKNAIRKQVIDNRFRPYWGLRVGSCEAGALNVERIESRFTDTSLRPSHQAAQRYAFGGGYWVGREALPLIAAAGAIYRDSVLEDVCTGHVRNAAGIQPPRMFLPHFEHPREPNYLAASK